MRLTPAIAALVLVGCPAEHALDGAECPCSEGFACCPATGTCMPVDLAACPLTVTAVTPEAGSSRGGTALTVTTSEVPVDLRIAVGDSPCADLERISNTQVRCVTTPGPVGVADVVASTDRGREGVLQNAFEYLPEPDAAPQGCVACPLALTAIEPTTGPVEGGTWVKLVGDGFREGLVARVGARPCLDVVIHGPTQAACLTPPGDGVQAVVDVVVEASGDTARLADAFRYTLPAFTDLTPLLGGFDITGRDGLGVTLYDLDGDGVRDVYFSRGIYRNPRHAGLLQGQGEMRFELPLGQAGLGSVAAQNALIPGDFNGDGITDVVAEYQLEHAQEQVHLALVPGRDNGVFGAPAGIELTEFDERIGQDLLLHALDADGDGDLDLLGCRRLGAMDDADRLIVSVNNEGGEFRESAVGEIVNAGSGPTWCADLGLGDYDADGDVDLAVCGHALRVYRNDGGRFVDVTLDLGLGAWFDGQALPSPCHAVEWVDVDADGRLDLVWFSEGAEIGDGVFIARNDGAQLVRQDYAHPTLDDDADCLVDRSDTSLAIGAHRGAWIDADHDGDVDLLLPSPYWFSVCVRAPYLLHSQVAQGEAAFAIEVLRPEPAFGVLHMTSPTGMAAADLDGDGDLDVVANSWGANRRFLLRNNHAENQAPGRHLVVVPLTDPDGDATDGDASDDRPAPFVTVHLDLDGPEDRPDFAPGPGKLRVAHRPVGLQSSVPEEVHFGLGDRTPPVWVRVLFADGTAVVERVDAFNTRVEIRDR